MEYTLYKPTKSIKGAAFKFNLHKSGKFSFLKAAPQIAAIGSDKVFGWADDTSINAKMNIEDLGAMLSVILKLQNSVSLYHQTDAGNKIIEFAHVPDRKGYSLKISSKEKGAENARNVFIGISYTEAMILRVYCETVIRENLYNANR